jgi:two-component sensor histidine kinase
VFVGNLRSLSHILLLQADNFSDLQIQEFFRDTLEQLQKNMRNSYAMKTKVSPNVKALSREYIEALLLYLLLMYQLLKSYIS